MGATSTGTRQRTPLPALAGTLVATAAVLAACTTSEHDPHGVPPEGLSGESASASTHEEASTPVDPTQVDPAQVDPAQVDPAQVDTVQVVVVGDELTRTPAGTPAWPTLLAADLESAGLPVDVAVSATPGAGFGPSPHFADLVPELATLGTQLMVLFDGRLADLRPAAVEEAVTRTAVAVERASPDALLVVVGPVPADGRAAGSPAAVPALRTAAEEAGATYVDPAAEDWSSTPTAADLAAHLEPHLRPLVEALAASGANR